VGTFVAGHRRDLVSCCFHPKRERRSRLFQRNRYSTTSADNSLIEWFVEDSNGAPKQAWKIETGGGGYWANITGSTDVTDGQWHHVAFVADGTTRVKIYLDGVEETTTYSEDHSSGEESDFIADTQSISAYNHYLYIGARVRTSNDHFMDGQIDDVRIYNTALDQDDIDALYNYGYGCQ
jgi:hypothetical protein